ADVGYISLILIGAIYGLQAIIFILRREWQHVGWMVIYLLAYPLWSFVLPVYSFWHFDDFSWGNTRVVVGDGKRKIIVSDDKPFDPESIPQRRWAEYEQDLTAAGVLNAPPPNMNPNAGSSREDDRMSMYSRQSGAAMNRIVSMYGYSNAAQSAAGANQYSISRSATPSTILPSGDQRFSMVMASQPNAYMPYAMVSQAHSTPSFPIPDMVVGGAISSSPAPRNARPTTMLSVSPPYQRQSVYIDHMSQEYAAIAGNGAVVPEMPSQPRPVSSHIHSAEYHTGASPIPSDEQIVEAIHRILAGSDLTTLTKKRVRMQLAQEFNADLSLRKEFISDVVDRMLSGAI
ncbi:hypothetical protein GGI12_004724, partial [Dipsacomyces acuminosporus]